MGNRGALIELRASNTRLTAQNSNSATATATLSQGLGPTNTYLPFDTSPGSRHDGLESHHDWALAGFPRGQLTKPGAEVIDQSYPGPGPANPCLSHAIILPPPPGTSHQLWSRGGCPVFPRPEQYYQPSRCQTSLWPPSRPEANRGSLTRLLE